MDMKEIQKMFSEMGLGTTEQRDKILKEFSINMVDNTIDKNVEIKTCSNTLKE